MPRSLARPAARSKPYSPVFLPARWALLARALATIGLLWALTWTAAAQTREATPETAFAEAYEAYVGGFDRQAALAFDRFLDAHPDHPHAPEALFFQAQATLAAGLDDEATRLFASFQERFPQHPLAFQARLALGTYFYETGRYGRAIDALQQVVDATPPAEVAAKAYYWMGEAAFRLNRFDEGIRYLESAGEYRNTETAPLAFYAIGVAHVRRGRPAEAVRAFERLSIRYPDSRYAGDIGLALAEAYYELDEYERVIEEIESRMRSFSGEVEQRARFLLAEAQNQLGRRAEAIVLYRDFLEDYPESPYFRRAQFGLGWNYYQEGSYQWAAEQFALVHDGYADELAQEAAYYHGAGLYRSRRLEDAARQYEAVVSRWPEGEWADDALYELGLTRYELRRWTAAEDAFARLPRAYPDSRWRGEALRMLGESQVAQGEFDRAGSAFSEAIDLDAAPAPLRRQVAFQQAWLFYNTERYDEAAPAFLRLYEADPSGELGGDALFWAAESFYQIGQYDRAERLFLAFMREFPAHQHAAAAHYALGWTHFRQGQYARAVDHFQRFLEDYRGEGGPQYAIDARLRLADAYYAMKRYPEAIRLYSEVQGDFEDYALYQKGLAQYHSGRRDASVESLRALLEEYPYSEWREEALYRIAYVAFEEGAYPAAVADYTTLVRRFPDHPLAPRAQYGIGDAFFNAGEHEQAVTAYREVLDTYPNSPYVIEAVGGIAYALQILGREDDMDEILEAYLERNPDSPIVDALRYKRAEVLFQTGRFESAIRRFEEFIAAAGGSALAPRARLLMGQAYENLDRREESEAQYRQVIDDYPESESRFEAQQRLGKLYLDEERYEEALRLYASVDLEGRDPAFRAETIYGRAMALLGLGRTDEAMDLLDGVVASEIDGPELLPAKLGLARVHEEQGRAEEAVRLYRQVVEDDFDEYGAEALYRLGVLFLEQDSLYPALEELGRISTLYPGFDEWVARGYLAQAQAYLRLNQPGNAVQMYDAVLEQFPGTPFAEEARRAKARVNS